MNKIKVISKQNQEMDRQDAENRIFEVLKKLHKTGVKLDAHTLYRTMGEELSNSIKPLGWDLVNELISLNILVRATSGVINEYGLNPALASLVLQEPEPEVVKDPTDQGQSNPLGFRRFLNGKGGIAA